MRTCIWNTAAAVTALLLGATSASADVFISEIADPNDNANARFVELFNSGPGDVDLTGWSVRIYFNANGTPGGTANLSGTIACGETYVIGSATNLGTAYGITPDVDFAVNSNGDDNFELFDGVSVVDTFGNPGTQALSTDNWYFQDGYARRLTSIIAPSAAYNAAEWDIQSDGNTNPQDAADMTPGAHGGTTNCVTGGINITLDGDTSDADYVSLGTYTQGHGYGDHGLKELKAAADSDYLYVAINGEMEDNFNAFFLFIDTENNTGIPAGTPLPGNSEFGNIDNTILDFEVDYVIRLGHGGGATDNYINAVNYVASTGGYVGNFADDGSSHTISGAGYTLAAALQDPADLSSTTVEGLEYAIPYATIGAAEGETFKLMVAYLSGDSNGWSSDIIPEVPGNGSNNLGSDPNLIALADRQWAAFDGALVNVPHPTITTAFTSGTANLVHVQFGALPTVPVAASQFSLNDSASVTVTGAADLGSGAFELTLSGNASSDLTSDTLSFDNINDDPASGALFAGIMDLATVRASLIAGDSLGGATMTVTGTVIEDLFDVFNADNVTVQQGTAGIVLRDASVFDLPGAVDIGDVVQFAGKMDAFNGLSQITAGNGEGLLDITGTAAVPAPAELDVQTVTAADFEEAESTLVKLVNVTFDAADGVAVFAIGGSGQDYQINSANPVVIVRVDRDVEATFEASGGQLIPEGTGSVTGIVGQYDSAAPFDAGYQLMPRAYSDLDFTTSVNEWMLLAD